MAVVPNKMLVHPTLAKNANANNEASSVPSPASVRRPTETLRGASQEVRALPSPLLLALGAPTEQRRPGVHMRWWCRLRALFTSCRCSSAFLSSSSCSLARSASLALAAASTFLLSSSFSLLAASSWALASAIARSRSFRQVDQDDAGSNPRRARGHVVGGFKRPKHWWSVVHKVWIRLGSTTCLHDLIPFYVCEVFSV